MVCRYALRMYGRGFVQLHLKSKEAAYGGIMMALAVILIILSGIIEQSSLFLLAAASFITGVIHTHVPCLRKNSRS